MVRPVIWLSEPLSSRLGERLTSGRFDGGIVTSSEKEFLEATSDPKTVSFLDDTTLSIAARIDQPLPSNIIAICDDSLQAAIAWLQYPWLSHIMSATMVEHPMADQHLDNVVRTMTSDVQPRLLDWLEPSVAGRRIRLTHSSKRAERLERMSEFFASQGVSARTVQQLQNAAEELLTNAFYNAPVTAGAMKKPISRTQDVALPDDSACDLAYGSRQDLAIVRVRDPFGSLSRRRLVEVLRRCSRTDGTVEVDETMGGAGLGLWRIFAAASFVAVSVVKSQHTEFLVGIAKRDTSRARPFALHLFFTDSAKRSFWRLADEDSKPSVNKSVTMVVKSKQQ